MKPHKLIVPAVIIGIFILAAGAKIPDSDFNLSDIVPAPKTSTIKFKNKKPDDLIVYYLNYNGNFETVKDEIVLNPQSNELRKCHYPPFMTNGDLNYPFRVSLSKIYGYSYCDEKSCKKNFYNILLKEPQKIELTLKENRYDLIYIDISYWKNRSNLIRSIDSIFTKVLTDEKRNYSIYLSNGYRPIIAKKGDKYKDILKSLRTINSTDPPIASTDKKNLLENLVSDSVIANNYNIHFHYFISGLNRNSRSREIMTDDFLTEIKSQHLPNTPVKKLQQNLIFYLESKDSESKTNPVYTIKLL